MREENFLSSWLREDGGEEEEGTVKMNDENEEDVNSTPHTSLFSHAVNTH